MSKRLWLLMLAASCATAPASVPPGTAPTPPPAAALPPGPSATVATTHGASAPTPAWAAMDFGERKRHMKNVVLPKMKEVFVAFDAARYGKMTCVTCHGEGAADGSFHMPNPALPKLPTNPEGFKKLLGDKPTTTQFMLTKVKPMMAKLLGLPEMTPDTRTGFGCTDCHGK